MPVWRGCTILSCDDLRNRWAQLWTPSTRPSKHAFLRSVFSLRLDTVPSKIWDHPEITRLPQPTVKDTRATHQAIQAAWRTQVFATLHTIWRWRSEPDTPKTLWTPAQARAYHEDCMRATLTDLRWRRMQDSAASCHTAAAIEIIRSWDPDREVEPAPGADASAPIYVMFFDADRAATQDQAAAERSSSARTTMPSRHPSSGQQQRHWPIRPLPTTKRNTSGRSRADEQLTSTSGSHLHFSALGYCL